MRPSGLLQTVAEVRESMAALGVHLRQDWVAHCLEHMNAAGRGTPQAAKEEIYQTLLVCDLREAGEGCLPAGVGDMTKERISGKMVVQVESARDVAKSFEQREKLDGSSAHHTLKLALGDGKQTVAAFEYRRIQGLSADPPPGLKLLLVQPWVRRGMLLLSSENTTVLGGEVASLVAARDSAQNGEEKTGEAATNGSSSHGHNQPTGAENGATPNSRQGGNGARQPANGSGRQTRPSPPGRQQQPSAAPTRAEPSPGTTQTRRDDTQGRSRGTGGSSGAVARPGQGPERTVFNPYAGITQIKSNPAVRAAAGTTSSNDRPSEGVTRSRESRGRAQGGEARVPAFRDFDEDEPEFEYDQEPDLDDDMEEEQQPPDETPVRNRGGSGGRRIRSDPPLVVPFGSSTTAFSPPETPGSSLSPLPPPPPVTPQPRIVSARVQHERLREEGRRRSRDARGNDIADIEGESGGGSERDWPRKKRGRTQGGSSGGEWELGDDPSFPPRGPFTCLADLEGPTATGGGVYRAKAVVSDTMGCKLRKKKYLLVIEIEDGTAVLRVRLSDTITKRLFGVDAREYKKICQADRDQGFNIQARVEQEIRQMEGVMEIDFAPAAAATQSPGAPETPCTAASQGSASGDSEWSLPVLLSVSRPTDADCSRLLSRVQALL